MPFNLLLFPLVAGYYVLIRFRYFRYIQQRMDRQRLLFNSILLGILILVITILARIILEALFPKMIPALTGYLPLQTPYFGTTVFSLLISVALVEIGNRFISRAHAIKYAIKFIGDESEIMLKDSVIKSLMLQFTLSSKKVYVGWVKELPLPFSNCVRIIPAFSGYRNDEGKLEFTTQYLSVYATYIEDGQAKSINDLNTDLIIKKETIVTMSYFDIEMYNRFNEVEQHHDTE